MHLWMIPKCSNRSRGKSVITEAEPLPYLQGSTTGNAEYGVVKMKFEYQRSLSFMKIGFFGRLAELSPGYRLSGNPEFTLRSSQFDLKIK